MAIIVNEIKCTLTVIKQHKLILILIHNSHDSHYSHEDYHQDDKRWITWGFALLMGSWQAVVHR